MDEERRVVPLEGRRGASRIENSAWLKGPFGDFENLLC